MRKALVFWAMLVSAGLAAEAASAATYSTAYCRSRLERNVRGCHRVFDYNASLANSCSTDAVDRYATCMAAGTKGGTKLVTTPPKYSGGGINNPQAVSLSRPSRVQRGPNLVTKPTKFSGSGINNPQAVPLTPTKYVRPVAGGNPCTVHCGPVRPSSKGR